MEKQEERKFVSQNRDIEKEMVSFLRGWLIVNFKRSFFVVDCYTGLMYQFKKVKQQTPTDVIHLGGGKIYESNEEFEDQDTKERFKTFEVTVDHVTYQIVPENQAKYDSCLNEFYKMVDFPKPTKVKRKMVAKGAAEVVKAPWRLVSKYPPKLDPKPTKFGVKFLPRRVLQFGR